jgi:hypothetical protein
MFSKELGHILQALFQEHRKVRSDLDLMTFLAEDLYKTAEMQIELWRSAGQIDKLATGTLSSLKDQLHSRPFHRLRPVWRCLQMAVDTLLVAPESQVHLQGLDFHTMQSVTINPGDLSFEIVHGYSPYVSSISFFDVI